MLSEATETTKIAYGDESVLLVADPPLYLVGASVFTADADAARRTLEGVKPKGASKLHWRSMTDPQKADSVAAISSLGHQTTIVAASPLNGVKQERARRKCLESLLIKLESEGVDTLVLESRREALDKRDRDCLLYARRSNAVHTIDIAHVVGEEDALLWMPDQILGAYGEGVRGLKAAGRWAEDWRKVMESVELVDVRL